MRKNLPASMGDVDLILGLGRSPGEGIGYPLQYSWAFLVAQLVKNKPAMQQTWVRSLGWEDPLEDPGVGLLVEGKDRDLSLVFLPCSLCSPCYSHIRGHEGLASGDVFMV